MMDKIWYQFKDESKTEIIGHGSLSQPDTISELLDPTDARVISYLGPEEEREAFQVFEISNIEDLLLLYKILSCMSPPFYFRGESDVNRSISTTIERGRSDFFKDFGTATFEHRILFEAQRRGSQYFNEVPLENDVLGWLSLIRHQGIPTRLVDVTRSIFIAAFFALEKKKNIDAVIWGFSSHHLENGLHSNLMQSSDKMFWNGNGHLFDNYVGPTLPVQEVENKKVSYEDIRKNGNIDKLLLLELAMRDVINVAAVMLLVPKFIHKRQDIQQGAFFVPLNTRNKTFVENLEETFNINLNESKIAGDLNKLKESKTILRNLINIKCVKLIIKKSAHEEILNFLQFVNIKDIVLFPDAEGFSRELSKMVK